MTTLREAAQAVWNEGYKAGISEAVSRLAPELDAESPAPVDPEETHR